MHMMDWRGDIALAFDLDDTLYDERDYARACLQCVARELSPMLEIPAEQLERDMTEAGNPYEGLCAGAAESRVTLSAFKSLYRSASPEKLPLRPDARQFLEALKQYRRDVPLYLITDGRLHGQSAKIKALGLERFFAPDHIIISAAIGHDKNTPMPFVTAMMREDRYKGWVYFGDNVAKDFHWPRRMGWYTVMITDHGRNVHAQPPLGEIDPDFAPDTVIDSFDNIINSICPQLS